MREKQKKITRMIRETTAEFHRRLPEPLQKVGDCIVSLTRATASSRLLHEALKLAVASWETTHSTLPHCSNPSPNPPLSSSHTKKTKKKTSSHSLNLQLSRVFEAAWLITAGKFRSAKPHKASCRLPACAKFSCQGKSPSRTSSERSPKPFAAGQVQTHWWNQV